MVEAVGAIFSQPGEEKEEAVFLYRRSKVSAISNLKDFHPSHFPFYLFLANSLKKFQMLAFQVIIIQFRLHSSSCQRDFVREFKPQKSIFV